MRANKAPASSASSSRSSVSSSDASREELLEEMEKLKKEIATLKMLRNSWTTLSKRLERKTRTRETTRPWRW